MNSEETDAPFPLLRADGSLACGEAVCQPWPSLATNPEQTLRFAEAILRAAAGSPIWPFVERIPERVRRLVGAMPSRRWELLELCAEDSHRGPELLGFCPALALLLVDEYRPARHGSRRAYFRAMVALSWRELLPVLELPDRPGTIRLLKKLHAEDCRPPLAGRLRQVLCRGHRWRHVLPHLPRITQDTLGLLRLDPVLVSPALLRASAGSQPDEEPVTWLLCTVKGLRAELDSSKKWPYADCDCKGLESIERRLRSRVLADSIAVFPPPPIPAKPGVVVPILRWADLAEEGERQQNCCATFTDEIMGGGMYFYRALRPERATLAIRKSPETGAWEIHDLRGANNAGVSPETKNLILAWLQPREAPANPEHQDYNP
jgi:hypothetical protein